MAAKPQCLSLENRPDWLLQLKKMTPYLQVRDRRKEREVLYRKIVRRAKNFAADTLGVNRRVDRRRLLPLLFRGRWLVKTACGPF